MQTMLSMSGSGSVMMDKISRLFMISLVLL